MRKLSSVLLAIFSLGIAGGANAAPEKLKNITLDPERTIVFRGEVDDALADTTINKLIEMNELDKKKTIHVIINSPGGSVPAGFRLIAAMDDIDAPIVCIVDTGAYSMAAIMTQFCDKTYMQKYAEIMFHEASFGVRGSESQVASEFTHVQLYLENLHREVAAKLGMDYDTYRKTIRNEWWLTARKAAELGVVDGTVDALKYKYDPPATDSFPLFKFEPSQRPGIYFIYK